MLSLLAHTPLTQTSAPAAAEQTPFSVGLEWAASVGTATPFASWGVHWCAVSLHQLPAAQSASTSQPPSGMQTPLEPQEPERQTVAPVVEVQGPSPFA